VLRKINQALRILPLLAISIPVVVVVRLIRPLLLVRWGILSSSRIGHFAANTELHLCEQDAGINLPAQRHLDIFFIPQPACNQQLAKMWRRVLRVWPDWFRVPIHQANRLVPGGKMHLISENTQNDRDVHNLLDQFPPHLDFTVEEMARGESGLRMMGVPAGTPFVCLIARDSAYLDAYAPKDWSYHNYRDSDIQNYVLAAEELADCGYFVIRIGANVHKAINSNHPRVIDYATNGMRSDFMDIYLGAKCEVCISGIAGFEAVPVIFRRPMIWVNMVPFISIQTFSSQLIGITKHHYSVIEERELTLKEIFCPDPDFYQRTSDYESQGIQLIENTPEEIRDVAVEMVSRLKGTWRPQRDDEALQRRFWKIYPSDTTRNGTPMHGEVRSRIGAAFLRDNPNWLE